MALAAYPRTQPVRDDELAQRAIAAQAHAQVLGAALVTPLHLLRVATRDGGASLDRALATVGIGRPELMHAIEAIADTDEAPGSSARYVVVVRGNDFLDSSNAYDTLNEAKRARAALRERAFGIPLGMRDRADPTPFWLRIPERIAEATDITIRDLEGG